MARDQQIELELQRIEKKNGILRARDIIREAAEKASPLHDCFTWDNSKAAYRWRLHEARRLIRTTIHFIPTPQKLVRIRMFWSLSPDRTVDGGGYRPNDTVMTTDVLREQLLHDALRELQTFQVKYQSLTELASIFDAINRVNNPPRPTSPQSDHRRKPGKGRPRKSPPASGPRRKALTTAG